MIIDCDSCAVRAVACHDCVVTVLLGSPPVDEQGAGPHPPVELDGPEQEALAVLADSGLVPPLRLVPRMQQPRPRRPPQAAAG